MTELIFLLALGTLVLTLGAALVRRLRGAREGAWRLVRRAVVGTALYLGVLLAVSLATPAARVAVGTPRCFDDWCLTVLGAEPYAAPGAAAAEGRLVALHLRVSSRARGRVQRAASVAVTLRDDTGHRIEPSASGQAAWEAQHGAEPPLTVLLQPGEAVATTLIYAVPAGADSMDVLVRHPVGPAPGLLIVGDEQSLLHRPTSVRVAVR